MNIVFMGTPEFAVYSLKKIIDSSHSVVGVVTVPDKAQGRGLKIKHSAVKAEALKNNIPVLQPEKLKDESFLAELKKLNADLFVVVAFRILPEAVFMMPEKGTVNLHASLLPSYRGAAPINWAIMNGDEETGITSMMINKNVDTGGILLQEKISIGPDMTAGELHDTLAENGSGMLVKTLDLLEAGKLKPQKQNDNLATKAPKLNKEICRIDFTKQSNLVHNQIRGLSPYPAAFCLLEGKPFKIYSSNPVEFTAENRITPGEIVAITKNSFVVACGNQTALAVTEVQLAGKKRMDVRSFFNGYSLNPGDVLE